MQQMEATVLSCGPATGHYRYPLAAAAVEMHFRTGSDSVRDLRGPCGLSAATGAGAASLRSEEAGELAGTVAVRGLAITGRARPSE